MPYRDTQSFTPFTDYIGAEPEAQPASSWGEAFGAAFRLENDVLNAWDYLHRPAYEDEINWDQTKWLKENNLWENYRENFIGARSQLEAESILGRIRQEEKDNETLERSGWAGISAGIIAGTLSPTMFIPLMGGGRGMAAFARAAGLGLAAGAAQEIPLAVAQETRSTGQVVAGLAASTILGGLLGGAAANLSREQLSELANGLRRDMGSSPVEVAIPTSSTVGAAASRGEDAGATAGSLGSVTAGKFMSPVLRTIEQTRSSVGRYLIDRKSVV